MFSRGADQTRVAMAVRASRLSRESSCVVVVTAGPETPVRSVSQRYKFSSYIGFSRPRSPQPIFHIHSVISAASSSVISAPAMSSLSRRIHTHPFRPSRFRLPGDSILSILLPICPSSFLRTCPNHLSTCLSCFLPKPPHLL